MANMIFPCGCTFPCGTLAGDVHVFPGHTMPIDTDLDIYHIPTDCHLTWSLISSGQTKGVFQLESHLGRTWAAKVQPENLEDMSALVALLRPGCLKAVSTPAVKFLVNSTLKSKDGMQIPVNVDDRFEISKFERPTDSTVKLFFPKKSMFQNVTLDDYRVKIMEAKSMTQRYVDRKHKLEDIEYLHDSLEPILGTTHGVLTYQEQSMKISVSLAGFDLQQADILRKAIGKKKPEIMAKVKTDFMKGCIVTAIVDTKEAEEIFGWVEKSQRYSFNKSHSVSYGMNGYWTAYCKAHFPVQFYCSFLDGAKHKPKPLEEIASIVSDAKVHDIDILPPTFGDHEKKPYIRDNKVRFGMWDVKNIGESALNKIIAKLDLMQERLTEWIPTGRNGGQMFVPKDPCDWTWNEYLMWFSDEIDSRTNESLIYAGALDYMGIPRSKMLYQLKQIWGLLTKKEKEWCRENEHPEGLLKTMQLCAKSRKDGGGCTGQKRVDKVKSACTLLNKPPFEPVDTADFIAWSEENYLGTAITCSRVDGCAEAIQANVTCKEVVKGAKGYLVVAAEVARVQEYKTKKGKNPGQIMAFLSVQDSTCTLDDLVIFPKEWKEYSHMLYAGNTVLMQIDKGKKRDSSLIVQKVEQI